VKQIDDAVGKGKAEFMKLDLASLSSVRTFVSDFKGKDFPALDVLINNAGVMWCPYTETEDGFELQIGTNHLGHFLLTLLLLDELKKNKNSRVVNVSSRASERPNYAKINFDDLNNTKSYAKMNSYGQSKLANVLFSEELSRKLKGTGITTYSLHPGAVSTELLRYMPFFLQWVFRPPIGYLFPLKTPVQGAQTTVFTAVAPNIEKYSGMYFADCKVKENPNPMAGDKEAAKKLWELSEKLVKEKFPQ